MLMTQNIITISPEIQSGAPVFKGTRVPVKNLYDYLLGGDTIDEFLNDFPSVKREQVIQLLQLMKQIFTLSSSTPHEKMLLDENLPRPLKNHFSDKVEIFTVPELGWASKKMVS